jgi:hypothetical protein
MNDNFKFGASIPDQEARMLGEIMGTCLLKLLGAESTKRIGLYVIHKNQAYIVYNGNFENEIGDISLLKTTVGLPHGSIVQIDAEKNLTFNLKVIEPIGLFGEGR